MLRRVSVTKQSNEHTKTTRTRTCNLLVIGLAKQIPCRIFENTVLCHTSVGKQVVRLIFVTPCLFCSSIGLFIRWRKNTLQSKIFDLSGTTNQKNQKHMGHYLLFCSRHKRYNINNNDQQFCGTKSH